MAEASAVDEVDVEAPPTVKGLKRRQSEGSAQDEEGHQGKKQRISPGKNSPLATTPTEKGDSGGAVSAPEEKAGEGTQQKQPADSRRKPSAVDEKQRSKRLFGALLGSLNQPSDRAAKRRQEIESRRKAELQRQDDEHVEDKARKKELWAEQRKVAQVKVDEENMRIRHRNMLDRANFLQTISEPKLFYRPWDLRPDEEDRIEDQTKETQAQIDKELEEFNQRHRPTAEQDENGDFSNGRHGETTRTPMQTKEETDDRMADGDDHAPAKSATANDDISRPAEVPESDPTNHSIDTPDENGRSDSKAKGEKMDEEEGEHIVEGDEDTVIY